MASRQPPPLPRFGGAPPNMAPNSAAVGRPQAMNYPPMPPGMPALPSFSKAPPRPPGMPMPPMPPGMQAPTQPMPGQQQMMQQGQPSYMTRPPASAVPYSQPPMQGGLVSSGGEAYGSGAPMERVAMRIPYDTQQPQAPYALNPPNDRQQQHMLPPPQGGYAGPQGYTDPQGGYPGAQGGYPGQQGGYPGQLGQQGYPTQQSYPQQRPPGYPPQGHRSDQGGHPRGSGAPPPLRDPTNTVWVGNADGELSDDALRSTFAEFGTVMRVGRLPEKCVAFVHFRTPEEATNAIQTLSARGAPVDGRNLRYNYGKNFTYSEEELRADYNPANARRERRDRNNDFDRDRDRDYGGGGGGGDREYRRHDDRDYDRRGERDNYERDRDRDDRDRRGGRDRMGGGEGGRRDRDEGPLEPTNVLWIGDLPPDITDEDLRRNFGVFGEILQVNRVESKCLGFIHFDTVEHCTKALSMRGVRVKGIPLKLNFGKAQRSSAGPGAFSSDPGEIPANEHATNVVWVGQLPPDATTAELNEMFDRYPGFIDAKLLSDKNIAFGHYDTPENARAARVGMHGQSLHGSTLKVSFGKTNHSKTMADRYDRKGTDAPDDMRTFYAANEPTSAAAPPNLTMGGGMGMAPDGLHFVPAMSNALTAYDPSGGMGGALLPVETTGSSNFVQQPKFVTRPRETPSVMTANRAAALLAANYYGCGEIGRSLIPPRVMELLDRIDHVCAPEDTKALRDLLIPNVQFSLTHIISLCAKRLKEWFAKDIHKKLLVYYVIATILHECTPAPPLSSMEAFVVLTSFVAEGQDAEGYATLGRVIESVKQHYLTGNISAITGIDETARLNLIAQFDAIIQKGKVSNDLAQLMMKAKR